VCWVSKYFTKPSAEGYKVFFLDDIPTACVCGALWCATVTHITVLTKYYRSVFLNLGSANWVDCTFIFYGSTKKYSPHFYFYTEEKTRKNYAIYIYFSYSVFYLISIISRRGPRYQQGWGTAVRIGTETNGRVQSLKNQSLNYYGYLSCLSPDSNSNV
jgi:hypothetical protein